MIQLHAWPTPNAHKISIMLEETGLAYETVPVDITAGDQFKPGFLAISPNNRMPAIVDPEGPGGAPIAIFESGAILVYLADKTGMFLAKGGAERYAGLQWLMWQVGGVGPMFGQAGHFTVYAPEKIPYAIERYTNEVKRLVGVADRQLAKSEYLAGEYSIADMASFPWVQAFRARIGAMDEYPHVVRWLDAIGARPAVQRGLALLKDRSKPMDDKARENLFGRAQYEKR